MAVNPSPARRPAVNVTVVQNSAYGASGLVEKFIAAKGWRFRRTLSPDDIVNTDLRMIADDVMVFMGSPRGVYETHVQWIARQRALMRRLVAESVPVFGICFGGQLLSTAIGGTVAPMGFRYRGWRTNEHAVAPIWRGPWLRWHGDFITLPGSVEVFARDHGTVQAFRHGNAVGVQFHPEVDSALLHAWRREADIANPVVADAFAAAIRYADTHALAIEDQAFTLFELVFEMLLG